MINDKSPSLKKDFILIDIQTTGLRPNKDRIIEINLYTIKNGTKHTEWHCCINPKKKKKSNINRSSAILQKKINSNPYFDEIAAELHKKLKNKIIFAHNAYYTYNFLKHEMLRSSILLDEKILCSISLSRYLFPEHNIHTLQALNDRLSLNSEGQKPLELLFNFFNQLEKCLSPLDLKNAINILTKNPKNILPVEYKNNIPETAGVYFYYDKNHTLIYVGKSEHLSESLFAYFQLNKHSHKKIQLYKQISKIDWIKSCGKLGTALLAAKHIKLYKPLFNRLSEKEKSLYTIQLVVHDGYLALKIINIADICSLEFANTFGIFKNKKDLAKLIRFFIKSDELCDHINSLEKIKKTCFQFKMKKCRGACNKLESSEEYNGRVLKVMKTFKQNQWPFKNTIAIKEMCPQTNNIQYHLVRNWTYMDTVMSLDQTTNFIMQNKNIDVTIYHLIQNYLSNVSNGKNIIELKNTF